jgi:hypothetical protein
MPEYLAPAVFVEETSFRAKSIEGVGTSTAAFVGMTARGQVSVTPSDPTPPLLTSFNDFQLYYGGTEDLTIGSNSVPNYLAHAANAFFNNGGARLYVARLLGNGATVGTSGQLTAGAALAAAKKVAFTARQPGGATIPNTTANFSITITPQQLPTTKSLALKQPRGTMIQINDDFYVIGVDPVITTAGNLTGFTGLADGGACTIISFAIDVYDPTGLVYEAGALGLHPRHPRFIGALLGAFPPNASDAMTNPVRLDIGNTVTPFELRQALSDGAAASPVLVTGGTDGTGTPATADFQTALNSLLALEDVSIVAAPGSSSYAGTDPAAINQMLIGHAEARRAYRIAVLDTPSGLDIAGVRALKSQIDSEYAAIYFPWVTIANPGAALNPLAPGDQCSAVGSRVRDLCAHRHPARRVEGPRERDRYRRARARARCSLRRAGGSQSPWDQLHPDTSEPRNPGLGSTHHLKRSGMDIRERAALLPLSGSLDRPGHAMGRVRAQRRGAVGERPDHRFGFPLQRVGFGRAFGHEA